MNELALFAGIGGGILGGKLLGWRTRCAVEINPYCRRVLLARQRDGMLPRFPIWDDVRTFDGKPWRGHIDIVTGGFPCQDISAAGKGAGITGEKSGLWKEMARIISEVRPRYVLVENSPMLSVRGLHVVLGDLAAMGFSARWGIVSAADVGAPHLRERIWIVAHAESDRRREGRAWRSSFGSKRPSKPDRTVSASDPYGQGLAIRESKCSYDAEKQPPSVGTDWWNVEPDLGRVVHGVSDRVERIRGLGNAQVPAVVVRAWALLGDESP